jgi:hypothetical protein
LPGKANYFIGNDPKKWRTNVPTYARVKFRNVYPGIDLVCYGNQNGQLEYDFVVAPGADPSRILLSIDAARQVGSRQKAVGSGQLTIDSNGDLIIPIDGGEARFRKPVVYQEQTRGEDPTRKSKLETRNSGFSSGRSTIGNRQFLDGRFVLTASNQIRFAVGPYDHTWPLVIDPVLVYSTYLGGSGSPISADHGYGIAVDSFGYAYVTGCTGSADFPTVNPLQPTNKAYPNCNVFVAKLDPTGSALVYSTYLGGSGFSEDGVNAGDIGHGIAVDSSGNAYVTGYTTSVDFPTVNPFQASGGPTKAFVTKLDAAGSALVYSTYLGGSRVDDGWGIAIDSSGSAYVTGATSSPDFPTVNPIQATCGGAAGCGGGAEYLYDAFVTKFNAAGSALVYSTFLGGSNFDDGYAIAVDSSGNAYVAGSTLSNDFPTANPLQPTCGGGCQEGNAFVAKLNPAGSALLYSTYLGGSSYNPNFQVENGNDGATGIAVDSSGNAYVTGATIQTDFPAVNPIQATNHSSQENAFVTKFNAAGSALVYSTYLGGSGIDEASGIAVDSSGNAYVVGTANSADFPTANPVQATLRADYNAFVAELNPAGSALVYSTYLGGSGYPGDFGQSIAVDSAGAAYVTGMTTSRDFPTASPLQAALHTGNGNAFVTKISGSGLAPFVSCSPTGLTFGAQNVGATSAAQTVTVTNIGTASLTVSSVAVGGADASDFATSADTCAAATVTPNDTCMVSVTFTPSAAGSRTASLIFTDNASNSPQTLSLTGTGGTAPPLASVSPSSLAFSYEGVGTTSAPLSVTLSNTGNAALTITSIATSANFNQTNNCVGSVAGGSSCSIGVTFSPTAIGQYTGALTITDNSNGVAGSMQSVTLSGTGQDFSLAIAPGSSSSAAVAPGQTATYSVNLVPGQGGFNQSVNFTWNYEQMPRGSNGTVSPNPATPGSSVTTLTVTVTTTAPSVGAPRSRHFPPEPPALPGLEIMLMLVFIVAGIAWPLLHRSQPGTSRWRPSTLPLALGLLLTVGLAGCFGGGGSSGGGGNPTPVLSTPPGTYTMTLTGTAGTGTAALSHSLTLTLVVS